MSISQEEFNLGRIRWDCRRGIKEADVLLGPFFEARFASLSHADKQAFVHLLEQHDVDLFEWFTLRSRPEEADLQRMVDMIVAAGPVHD